MPSLLLLALLAGLPQDFANPPAEYRARPLYWLNGPLTPEALRSQLAAMRDTCGFGGLTPLAMGPTRPAYPSDGYWERYGTILDQAKSLGLKVVFYDDIDFPSGSVAGRFAKEHPDLTLKNLRKVETAVTGPTTVDQAVPAGVLQAAVAMETTTKQRVNLTPMLAEGKLHWAAPAGTWRVMFFVCEKGHARLVDFLEPVAVKAWLEMTYGQAYARFPRHFGDTITMAFYDDVALVYTPGGRTWTPGFNAAFQARHHRDPALLYPALWYDLGPETAAARVALLDTRAALLSESFVRTVHEWCAAHGIRSSGHPAGNYNPQPVEVSGDNMLFYKHSDVPLMDSIFYHGHGRDGFKLITSAMYCWDKPVTAVEIYGAFPKEMPASMLYRDAMEIYALGGNLMLPHGMWYDPANCRIPPEISHRSALLGAALPDYNQWVGRCSRLLQAGRHVADIGVLYPVASMQAQYAFDVPGKKQPNWGYDAPPGTDYLQLSARLTRAVHRDFTFLHPEVLDQRCRVEGDTLLLDNPVNAERYRVLVLPSAPVVPWSSLRRVREFWEHGGRLIATGTLPSQSAEFGHDDDVRQTVATMFGQVPPPPAPTASGWQVKLEMRGGTVRTFVDGALVDTTTDVPFAKGRVGFRESDHETGQFRDYRVTAPDGRELLRDDFRGGLDAWADTTNATAKDGLLTVGENQAMLSRSGADWTDYDVDCRLDSVGDEPVGLIVRAQDATNYLMWQFVPNRGIVRPHARIKGGWRVLKQVRLSAEDWRVGPFTRGRGIWHVPNPTAGTLAAVLREALPVPDVAFDPEPRAASGNGCLSYLHKVLEGREVWYFANATDDPVETTVVLRGAYRLEWWDPHTGTMTPAEATVADGLTRVRLSLAAVRTMFLVSA